jgi:methyltransferase (TIGR00027 family)
MEHLEPSDLAAIARTARWTAAVRAHESTRANDRLFCDPWATDLAGADGEAWWQGLAPQQREGSAVFQAIRTRFFDELLLRVTGHEHLRQMVLLAAGLDTRAFRLAWPKGTRLFELEQPQVLDEKARLLAEAGATATCERIPVGVDLAEPSWSQRLRSAGFAPQERSVWLLEGFLFYLSEGDVLQVLDQVSALAASGSWIGFDVMNQAMLTSPWRRDWQEEMRRLGVPQRSAMDEPEAVLGPRGWRVRAVQPGEETANFGRWPYPVVPRSQPDVPRSFLVTAERQDR